MQTVSNQGNRGAFIWQSTDAAEVIHVFGDVDAENEREFRQSIIQARGQDRPVVIDLTRCTFFCSRGLHVLFDFSKSGPPGSLSVTASPQIAHLFDIVGLSDLVFDRRTSPKATL